MKNLLQHLPTIIGIIFAIALVKCERSNTNSIVKKTNKKIDSLITVTTNNTGYVQSTIVRFQIEGLKTSKRMLYDNNYIIRTSSRPDSLMNSYDKQIEELEKQLIK
jgi:hypothetical protein